MERTANCLAKVERMRKTLNHQEADRVPVSDFFWGSFVSRWREELGLPADTSPYNYYDLDWQVTMPNMDPHIKPFEMLKETDVDVVVKTGYEATMRKKFADPMPEWLEFGVTTIEQTEAFQFDDPWDERRYFSAGDNQLAGVGDSFTRNTPAWIETVKSLRPNFAVFGSVCEANEYMTRIVGPENNLLWVAMYPDEYARFIERTMEFAIGIIQAQIKAADGLLDGMVIWGDIAYKKDVFFAPDWWRAHYKPYLTDMVRICHDAGLPVIYHGCGNVKSILPDFIEMGLDAFNPLEAKADLDVCDLRQQYGHTMGFCGNSDIRVWERGNPAEVRREVLHRLQAARGGGMIFQSDHSVASDVSGHTYDLIVNLVREFGRYPLDLPTE